MNDPREERRRAKRDVAIGLLLLIVGGLVTLVTYQRAASGGRYVIATGALLVGAVQLFRGVIGLAQTGRSFSWFVAWRYLMAPRPRRLSEPLVGFVLLCAYVVFFAMAFAVWIPMAPPYAFGGPDIPIAFFGSAAAVAALAPTYLCLAIAIATTTIGSPRTLRVSLWLSAVSASSALALFALFGAMRGVEDGGIITVGTRVGAGLAGLCLLGIVALFPFVREAVVRAVSLALIAVLGFVILRYSSDLSAAVAALEPMHEDSILGYPWLLVAVGGLAAIVGGVMYLLRLGLIPRSPLPRATADFAEEPAPDRLVVARYLRRTGSVLAFVGIVLLASCFVAPVLLYPAVGLLIAGSVTLSRAFTVSLMATHHGRARLQVMEAYDQGPGRWEALAIAGVAIAGIGLVVHMAGLVDALGVPTLRMLGVEEGEEFRPLWLVGGQRGAIILGSIGVSLAMIRYYFSFFTTVSIGGVTVGTMALLMVLSVMSGFENDLREKILGSNAHILITKPDGDFAEYREIGAKVATVKGVEAYSPYLLSEVVIAARQNYANVIIKGIDPMRVGKVTQLADDIDQTFDRPLERLYPLAADGGVLGPPPDGAPRAAPVDAGPVGDAMDPVPEDLDIPDFEPVDLSGGLSAPEESQEPKKKIGLASLDDTDPVPDDLDIPDRDPVDLSGGLTASEIARLADAGTDDEGSDDDLGGRDDSDGDFAGTGVVRADDLGLGELPPLGISPEVAELPGVLVGRELEKQLHNFVGQEVTVVSPLGQDTPLGPVPRTKRYRVAGTFFTGMYEYDLKYVYVELTSLQDFLDIGDQVNGIEVRIDDPNRTEPVMAALAEALGPAYRVQDWRALNRSLFSALKLEKIAMFVVLAIIILVASFSIVGNLVMIVIEKAREIAVLKTLGATDRSVTDIFISQGFVIGHVGMVVGVGLGLLHTLVTLRGFPLDANVYYIDRLPINLEPSSAIYVAAAAIVISTLATLYPAQLASAQRPVEGLSRE